jgi:hypothetical protein
MTTERSAYEESARSRKALALAFALASALQRHGITADEAANFTPDQWVVVAFITKVNPPSTMTIALVIEWLRGSEDESSYRVLVIEDETTQVAARGPNGDIDYPFTRLIAFDLSDGGAEVARIIAEAHRAREQR